MVPFFRVNKKAAVMYSIKSLFVFVVYDQYIFYLLGSVYIDISVLYRFEAIKKTKAIVRASQ